MTLVAAEELRWFESDDGRLLITIIRDRIDSDFGAIVLARDAKERFRFIADAEGFYQSPDEAVERIKAREVQLIADLDQNRVQGDEIGKPIDFFRPVVPVANLHPAFRKLSDLEGYSPARGIVEPMMRWYQDADGNFIEQFQTGGFDARLWELYLFAVFLEAGFAIDRSRAAPDFIVDDFVHKICVEATTINPTRDHEGNIVPAPRPASEAELLAFHREYMPVRYAGPLTAKLDKKYWELPHVQGKPLVFAIQDFHAPMSMVRTRTGLPIYLYGYDHDWVYDDKGKLKITPRKVEVHTWGKKTVQSGFFSLPGSEKVSAVLFNNSGTISKFNRMGLIAGFGAPDVRMMREGLELDLDPNASEPKAFAHDVNSAAYTESWIEGMDVFHNPRAEISLPPAAIPNAMHHFLQSDGQIASFGPTWQPLTSKTWIWIKGKEPPFSISSRTATHVILICGLCKANLRVPAGKRLWVRCSRCGVGFETRT